MEPTHYLYSRDIDPDPEDGRAEWDRIPQYNFQPVVAWVSIDNGTVTFRYSADKIRFNESMEYQLRPIPASPR